MPQDNCPHGATCPYTPPKPFPVYVRIPMAILVGSIILMDPIRNGLGLTNLDQDITQMDVVIKGTLWSPLVAIICSVVRAAYHNVYHYWDLFLDNVGVPGIALTLLVAASY